MAKFSTRNRPQEKTVFRCGVIGRVAFYMTPCGILTQFGQYDRCVDMPQEESATHYQMIAQYLLDRWDDAPAQISSPWWDDDLVLFGKSKPFHCAASNRIPLFFVGCIHLKCWGSLVGSNRNEVIASFLAEPAID